MNLEAVTIEDCLQLMTIGKCVIIEDGHVVDVKEEEF